MERSAAEWEALGVPERFYSRFAVLPALGWSSLARTRALRPDEVARLERIATGAERHPKVDMDRALMLLRHYDGRDACAVPELCAKGYTGCGGACSPGGDAA